MTQETRHFHNTVTLDVKLDYLLYLPPGYETRSDWPVILFLHGYGERGSDLEKVKLHGLPKNIAAGQDYPFVVISPQCPDTTVWPEQVEALNSLVGHILETYAVDPQRVYLTGLSMGGYGTWHLASRYPKRFAAIAPICGGGDWWMPPRLKDLPAWVFHGDADQVVVLAESQVMVDRLTELGADITFTVYPGVEHNSWTETYNNPDLYTWFLSHQRP